MLTHYLDSVRYNNYQGLIGAVYSVPDHRSGWRLIATYNDGLIHKAKIFNDMKKLGQAENIMEWEWHHVVEGNHLASVDFNGTLSASYDNDFPCVLVHGREEHSLYSRLFRTSAGKELFRNDYVGNESQRKASAREEALRNANWRTVFLERTAKLAQMYESAYAGDPVLQQIARNVFLEVKRRITGGAFSN